MLSNAFKEPSSSLDTCEIGCERHVVTDQVFAGRAGVSKAAERRLGASDTILMSSTDIEAHTIENL